MELKLSCATTRTHATDGSNRTFMELKPDTTICTVHHETVLIVPLWN